MKKLNYDIIIIGGGSAGLVASKVAAALGKKVALIENNKLGGSCIWTGCIPTKTLIKISQAAYQAKHLAEFGLKVNNIEIDISGIMSHIHKNIEKIYQTRFPETLKKLGIDVFFSNACFLNNYNILVDDKILSAKNFVLTTGSRPRIPDNIQGLQDVNFYTNETIFNLKELPKSILILGGGPVGAEMASCLNRLGVKCTLIEMNDRLLCKEDNELADLLTEKLIKEGVDVKLNIKGCKVWQKNNLGANPVITLECCDKKKNRIHLTGETILVAVGRISNTENLGLDKTSVKFDKKCCLIVNEYLQTTASHIYVAGDVIGPYQFSHIAEYQAVVATRNALLPFLRTKVCYNNVVWVTFTDPELASLGLSECQARKVYGDEIKIYRKFYKDNDRAIMDNNLVGMAKIICDKKNYIIGAHILGYRAGEMIHELCLGKFFNVKFSDFYNVIHAYPTYSEIIWDASKDAFVKELDNKSILKLLARLFRYDVK